MNIKTYKTMSMSIAYHSDMSTYPFWTKPYSRLVDVNIANNMLWVTFEEPSEPMEHNKQFTLMLAPIGSRCHMGKDFTPTSRSLK